MPPDRSGEGWRAAALLPDVLLTAERRDVAALLGEP